MDRPYVFVNMAMTLDGKIAPAGREDLPLGGKADRREMDRLRAQADVILWGGETLRAVGRPARVREPALEEARRGEGRSPQPANAVMTASGNIPADSAWFGAGDVSRLIFTGARGAPRAREAARGRAEVIVLASGAGAEGGGGAEDGEEAEGSGEVSPAGVLDHLAGLGMERVLLEGGGGLHWHFARAGLVDTLHVTLTPWLAGGGGAPTLLDGPGFPAGGLLRLRLEEVRQEGEEIFLRYRVAAE